MYLDFFGLRESPFSITPDPRFVFLSERHRDALAHLLFGIGQGGGGGFVQLTGEVGTGKTTLSRLLLEQLPDNARAALVLNPLLSPVELLETICEELHLDLDGRRGSLKALVDALNAHLLAAHAAGLRVVLIVDEAQNLSAQALEQVRLLTNLETATQKLLQIILLGQPELREKLARPELRQLAQRITARYHLQPLDARESDAYLRHRWAVAGGAAFPLTPAAVKVLHRHAGGIPRLLNTIADRALLAGYARSRHTIDIDLLDAAAREVLAPRASIPRRSRARAQLALAIAAVAALAIGIGLIVRGWESAPRQSVARTAASIHPQSTHPQSTASAPLAIEPSPSATRTPAAPTTAPSGTSPGLADTPAPVVDGNAFAQAIATSSGDAAPAWRELLRLWSLPMDASAQSASCPIAQSPGWFCASGKQSLSLLAQFDRPLLLRVRAGPHSAWAVLLGLGATRAELQLDGKPLVVRRAALEAATDGFAMIGRGPDGLQLPIHRGDRGTGVDWLRTHLHIAGASGSPYDAALIDAVRARQRDFGLHDDGVVGAQTWLALLASERAGPHLRTLSE